jgi:hypothetical protein
MDGGHPQDYGRAKFTSALIDVRPAAVEASAMTKFIIAMIIVGALLIGSLMALLRNRRTPMGSPEVLERVKQRERELQEQERREEER